MAFCFTKSQSVLDSFFKVLANLGPNSLIPYRKTLDRNDIENACLVWGGWKFNEKQSIFSSKFTCSYLFLSKFLSISNATICSLSRGPKDDKQVQFFRLCRAIKYMLRIERSCITRWADNSLIYINSSSIQIKTAKITPNCLGNRRFSAAMNGSEL